MQPFIHCFNLFFQVFVDIGETERSAGLAYTALSRAKSLQGILLEPFPSARLLGLNERHVMFKRRAWEEKLQTMLLGKEFL